MPWSGLPLGDSGDDGISMEPPAFDPLKPQAGLIEGSVADKARELRTTYLKRIIAPCARDGEGAASSLKILCDKIVQALTTADGIGDGYGEVIMETLRLCRILSCIVSSTLIPTITMADLEWFRSQASGRHTERPSGSHLRHCAAVAVLLRQVGHVGALRGSSCPPLASLGQEHRALGHLRPDIARRAM